MGNGGVFTLEKLKTVTCSMPTFESASFVTWYTKSRWPVTESLTTYWYTVMCNVALPVVFDADDVDGPPTVGPMAVTVASAGIAKEPGGRYVARADEAVHRPIKTAKAMIVGRFIV